jgi:uncharacterized protein (DUF486 family)
MDLADRHQGYVTHRPVGSTAGFGNLFVQMCEVVGNGHVLSASYLFDFSLTFFVEATPKMWTILLLIGSNIFMTFAWYGHLKYREVPLWKVILVSWSIAFFEYCLQVPANRIGAKTFSPDQLKVIQEVITLTVFGVFSTFYFGDKLHWNHFAAFFCLVAGAFFMFHKF